MKIEVQPCGLFVTNDMPYLRATSDGVIYDDGIIKIKCPSSCSDLTREHPSNKKKLYFFKHNSNTNLIEVNKILFFFRSKNNCKCLIENSVFLCLGNI